MDELNYLSLLDELKRYKWITVIEVDLTLRYSGKNIALKSLEDLGFMGYGLRKIGDDIEAIYWKKISDEKFVVARHKIENYIVHQSVHSWTASQVAGTSREYPKIEKLVS